MDSIDSNGSIRTAQRQTRRALAAGALVLVLLVCGCGVAAALGGAPMGGRLGLESVQLCMGVNHLPHWQVGITWISPYMSSLPPVMLQNPACALVPWPPYAPLRGGFAFP